MARCVQPLRHYRLYSYTARGRINMITRVDSQGVCTSPNIYTRIKYDQSVHRIMFGFRTKSYIRYSYFSGRVYALKSASLSIPYSTIIPTKSYHARFVKYLYRKKISKIVFNGISTAVNRKNKCIKL